MERYRLKADGRIVAVAADGSERPAVPPPVAIAAERFSSEHSRRIRKSTGLSQTEFAAQIGVPVDTVRNWEQGKRSPRGPARALLRVIERAPDIAFAALKS